MPDDSKTKDFETMQNSKELSNEELNKVVGAVGKSPIIKLWTLPYIKSYPAAKWWAAAKG